MTQEEIQKAFEGRWRIKGIDLYHLDTAVFNQVKNLCRDFFEAGILISEKATVHEVLTSGQEENAVIYNYPDDYSETLFRRWWKLYDKMVGRKDCEKKWSKLKRNEQEACVRVAPAYVASTPDKQFRKNPLSYLNQKAWNDEIIPRNNGNPKPTPEQQQEKLADILVG